MPIAGVACRIISTVITHFRTQFAIVSSRTICKILLVEIIAIKSNLKNITSKWYFHDVKFDNSNLDHNWLLYVLEHSHTLLSHGGSGMTVHMMGMTYCTVHHKFQLCTLGDNYINIEPRLMETPFLLYVRLQTEMLTVLTGGSPKAWTTDTCSTLPQACVTVQAMLKTGFVAVTSPQTNRTWFTTTRTLMRKRNIKKKIFNFFS